MLSPRPTLLALALLAPAAASQHPIQDFHQDVKARLAQLTVALQLQDQAAADELLALRDAVQSGQLGAAEAHVELFALLDGRLAERAALMAEYTDGIEADATDGLLVMDVLPEAFVVGEAFQDLTRAAAARRLSKSTRKHAKRVAVFAKSLQKSTKYDLVYDLLHPRLEPITPSDTPTPADAPARPLRIDVLLGGSDRLVLGDGLLLVGGTANLGAGDVSVTIDLPGQDQRSASASVDPLSGRWSLGFGDAAGLSEGNWAVRATQAGVTASDSLGIQ